MYTRAWPTGTGTQQTAVTLPPEGLVSEALEATFRARPRSARANPGGHSLTGTAAARLQADPLPALAPASPGPPRTCPQWVPSL